MKKSIVKRFLEPFIGSIGILFAGVLTIPFAGGIAGTSISYSQALTMGVVFFILRFAWLCLLRWYFSRSAND